MPRSTTGAMRRCASGGLIALLILAGASGAQAFSMQALEQLTAKDACRDCDLAGILMEDAKLAGVSMIDANVTAATFDSANLKNADLRRADLSAVDFAHANLTNARLQDSNLSGALFWDTDLTGANLTGARYDSAMIADITYCRTTMPSGRVRQPNCSGS